MDNKKKDYQAVPAYFGTMESKELLALQRFLNNEGYETMRDFAAKNFQSIQSDFVCRVPTQNDSGNYFSWGHYQGRMDALGVIMNLRELVEAEIQNRKIDKEKEQAKIDKRK